MSLLLAVCFNGNAVGCTNEVTLRWDQLVLGWMTILGWANHLGMGMGFPWKSCYNMKTWLAELGVRRRKKETGQDRKKVTEGLYLTCLGRSPH